ncbi:hypothetical protein GCM10019059_10460 [Camelimonas fluminis]|uniref:Urease accessory protein UreE n=1 Tax=Camelimonas fluminis TaxID=1576911 RepID=A0ABV7UDJ5_9HYPH|nr:urease accessory protein UreE [Camelimonas fluminis]GHE52920.1 hypothetical protein GCM10019059_10460 [Camelimonas fluminis]
MLKAIAVRRASEGGADGKFIVGHATLAHDERHLRRRTIGLNDGARALVDLPVTVALDNGDALLTDCGGAIAITAADEPLYDVRAQDPLHLVQLAWHLGNRHLAADITTDRILILRDHVIRAMLEGLGARVSEIVAPFQPVRGAYSGHGGHDHGHAHHEQEHHGHTHHSHDHRHD